VNHYIFTCLPVIRRAAEILKNVRSAAAARPFAVQRARVKKKTVRRAANIWPPPRKKPCGVRRLAGGWRAVGGRLAVGGSAKRANFFALKNKNGARWPQKKQSAYFCNFKKRKS
jgi:hypothetical protein